MNYHQIYQDKKGTLEGALALIQSGDTIATPIYGNEPTHGSYSASKHAMIGLTKNAATEYGPMDIRTCAVCPGTIATKMIRYLLDKLDYNVLGPMRRTADLQEIADVVCYLASDKASFLNGAIVRADSGQGL